MPSSSGLGSTKRLETLNHEDEGIMVFQKFSSSPVIIMQHHRILDVSAAPL